MVWYSLVISESSGHSGRLLCSTSSSVWLASSVVTICMDGFRLIAADFTWLIVSNELLVNRLLDRLHLQQYSLRAANNAKSKKPDSSHHPVFCYHPSNQRLTRPPARNEPGELSNAELCCSATGNSPEITNSSNAFCPSTTACRTSRKLSSS